MWHVSATIDYPRHHKTLTSLVNIVHIYFLLLPISQEMVPWEITTTSTAGIDDIPTLNRIIERPLNPITTRRFGALKN